MESNESDQKGTYTSVQTWEDIDEIERPGWPKVIGIISIIYAGLGLTCAGIGTAAGVFYPKMLEGQLDGDPVPEGMMLNTTDFGLIGMGLMLSLLLIFAGFRALTYKPQTRMLHLIWAGISIPLTVLSYLNNTAKQESIQEWAQQYPNNVVAESMNASSGGALIGQLIGLIIMIIFGFGIPCFYLLWFGVIKTKPVQITGSEEQVY